MANGSIANGSASIVQVAAVLAVIAGLNDLTEARAQNLCRPSLRFNQVQFSAIRTPKLQRNWTAIVSVDASTCAPNSRGFFDLVLKRSSETAPDLEFRERLGWSPPFVTVDLAFATDEAVESYQIENITPCFCRDRAAKDRGTIDGAWRQQ